MIHSILISEVKVTRTHVLWARGKIPNKKTLKLHLELKFNNFQERKLEKFKVDCYDILTIGIEIIGFNVNTINELILTIILYSFLYHILLEGEY